MAIVAATSVDWRRARRFVALLVLLLISLIVITWLYQALLLPIGVSLFLSFMLMPLVDAGVGKKIPRWVSSIVLLLIVALAVALVFVVVLPTFFQQMVSLLGKAPQAVVTWYSTLVPKLRSALSHYGITDKAIFDQALRKFNLATQIMENFDDGLAGVWGTGSRLLGGVFNIVLIPFLTFFWLFEKERIGKLIRFLTPSDLTAPLLRFSSSVARTIRDVATGLGIVALIDAILYMAGFAFLGVEAGITIGLVAGICRVIPYLDAVVALGLGLISVMAHFEGWGQALGVGAVVLGVQAVDGMFITPRVIGERVGLHPVVVILSVLAFGKVFGFWGVLLAIPAVAITKAMALEILPFYLASPAYRRPLSQAPIDAFGGHYRRVTDAVLLRRQHRPLSKLLRR